MVRDMSKDAKPVMSVQDNEKEEEKGMNEWFSEGLSLSLSQTHAHAPTPARTRAHTHKHKCTRTHTHARMRVCVSFLLPRMVLQVIFNNYDQNIHTSPESSSRWVPFI